MENWYAVRVRSNREKAVQAGLRSIGIEEFLPVYRVKSRWTDRVKEIERPLFPGYIFGRFDAVKRLPVLMLSGVVHVVGNGNGPIPVDETQLQSVRRFVESALPLAPWPYLMQGEVVRVEHGVLSGLEGIVLRVKDRVRLVVSLTLLQRSIAVELDRDCVRPVAVRTLQPVSQKAF